MADYDQAIKLNSNYAAAYRNRGNAKRKKGDLNGAMADFNRAIKLGLRSVDAVETPD
jgi:tetratricopeptide (TPR) repeat protein